MPGIDLADWSTLQRLYDAGGMDALQAYVGSRTVQITDVVYGEATYGRMSNGERWPNSQALYDLVESGQIEVITTDIGRKISDGTITKTTKDNHGEISMVEYYNKQK